MLEAAGVTVLIRKSLMLLYQGDFWGDFACIVSKRVNDSHVLMWLFYFFFYD